MTSDSSQAAEPGPQDDALPAIPVSAGALIFDREGRLLILKPTYKSGWTIPGGVMEADGETPWEACRREVREECGIEVRHGRLACMDFRLPGPGRPGGVRFLFDCGPVDDERLAAIVIQPEEVSEYRLCALADALPLLRARSGGGSGPPRPTGRWSTWKMAARSPACAAAPPPGRTG